MTAREELKITNCVLWKLSEFSLPSS